MENEDAYQKLWNNFNKDLRFLQQKGNHYSVDLLLHRLEKYLSFVPSITLKIKASTDAETFKKHPDVSLFDHSKITAAAAAALYLYLKENFPDRWVREILKEEITEGWEDENFSPFLLIGGDLSGVQRFIYTISSKGALKSLKGRSFFLELLVDCVCPRSFVRELETPAGADPDPATLLLNHDGSGRRPRLNTFRWDG